MKKIKLLQSRGVYAIACTIFPDKVKIKLLCLSGEQLNHCNLLDPESGDRYLVIVPQKIKGAAYNQTLKRYASSIQDI